VRVIGGVNDRTLYNTIAFDGSGNLYAELYVAKRSTRLAVNRNAIRTKLPRRWPLGVVW
jgi:hypothetical protein